MRALVQQFRACHQHTRNTKTALDRRAINKCLLERMKLATRPQSLNRGDGRAMRLNSGYQARHNRLAIQPDSTGTTFAFSTALFAACQSGILTLEVEQGFLAGTAKA